jgi:DNA mismatch repair protein MutL
MGKVHRLSDDLANQIAAGEVVERPASVVKELVENALDAGATRVRVDVDQGGVAMIRVADDGEGMEEEDARLAIERHATSKIARVEDLTRIATFGFRGEALPSIASVARLSLTTRARGSSEGLEITIDGGGAPRVRPAGCAEGTIVEVRDLFFNVPARRKFLKSTATESAHVGEVVMLAALARPDVTFILARDGKVAREWLRAPSRPERVQQVVAEERLEAMKSARGPMRIEAFLAPPERARAGAVALHVFVNGRPVQSRQVARAIAQGYGSVLEPGRYPVGVVYLELPHETVDVNVHPQKAEVRFQDARVVHDAVTRELYAALSKAFAIPALGPPSRPWMAPRSPAPTTSPGPSPTPTPTPGPTLDPTPTLFDGPGFYSRLRFVAQVRAMFLVCEGEDGLYVLDQHAAAERVAFDRLRRAFAGRSNRDAEAPSSRDGRALAARGRGARGVGRRRASARARGARRRRERRRGSRRPADPRAGEPRAARARRRRGDGARGGATVRRRGGSRPRDDGVPRLDPRRRRRVGGGSPSALGVPRRRGFLGPLPARPSRRDAPRVRRAGAPRWTLTRASPAPRRSRETTRHASSRS